MALSHYVKPPQNAAQSQDAAYVPECGRGVSLSRSPRTAKAESGAELSWPLKGSQALSACAKVAARAEGPAARAVAEAAGSDAPSPTQTLRKANKRLLNTASGRVYVEWTVTSYVESLGIHVESYFLPDALWLKRLLNSYVCILVGDVAPLGKAMLV